MQILDTTSLASTLDAVSEALFFGHALARSARVELAQWIAGRQGAPGRYAAMPAPTVKDIRTGVRLFTGERLTSRVGVAHVLGEEACRALILLRVRDKVVDRALAEATAGMLSRLVHSRLREINAGRVWRGEYCCARCTCGLWRHLTAGGLREADPEAWLAAGLANLEAHRDGRGKWRRFPLFYTLLALGDMKTRRAVAEMKYAAPVCERLLRSRPKSDCAFDKRRHTLAERILAVC